MRGVAVDVEDVQLPEGESLRAAAAFLSAVDGVLASATNAPTADRKNKIESLNVALEEWVSACAYCAGVMVYLPSLADELLSDMVNEMRGARDALRMLADSHWDAPAFREAAVAAQRIISAEWRPKWAPLAFTYDDRSAQAA